jgi:DNA-binding response OmpR family regulator
LLIAISGRYTKGSDRILGEISGFNYQLAKPFDPIEVIALLKTIKLGSA